jgi:hypothetical protein
MEILCWLPKSASADALVKTGPGRLWKVLVTSSSAGVIRLYDNTSAAATVILDQSTVVAGDEIELLCEFQNGLYFDLVSGSATVTILYI